MLSGQNLWLKVHTILAALPMRMREIAAFLLGGSAGTKSITLSCSQGPMCMHERSVVYAAVEKARDCEPMLGQPGWWWLGPLHSVRAACCTVIEVMILYMLRRMRHGSSSNEVLTMPAAGTAAEVRQTNQMTTKLMQRCAATALLNDQQAVQGTHL